MWRRQRQTRVLRTQELMLMLHMAVTLPALLLLPRWRWRRTLMCQAPQQLQQSAAQLQRLWLAKLGCGHVAGRC